jgi:hypothetical protein
MVMALASCGTSVAAPYADDSPVESLVKVKTFTIDLAPP